MLTQAERRTQHATIGGGDESGNWRDLNPCSSHDEMAIEAVPPVAIERGLRIEIDQAGGSKCSIRSSLDARVSGLAEPLEDDR